MDLIEPRRPHFLATLDRRLSQNAIFKTLFFQTQAAISVESDFNDRTIKIDQY